MGELLARMRESVGRCRDELAAPQRAADADARERARLSAEIGQLRGELDALQGEVERLRAEQRRTAQAQPVVYAQTYEPEGAAHYFPVYRPSSARRKRGRSRNRIVIASLSLALLALSIACFFLPWASGAATFTGYGALSYLFGSSAEPAAAYSNYLSQVIGARIFSSNETVSNLCRAICSNLLLYGTPLYAVSLLLGLPLVASVPGRVRIAAWHRFFAWLSFASAALLFAMIAWAGGFEGVSAWFLVGGIANFVRGILLIFYRGKWEYWGGLHN